MPREDGTGFMFGPGARRLQVIFVILMIALAGMAARLVALQAVRVVDLSSIENTRGVPVALQARRGTIYDRNGNILAMSEGCYDIYCDPQEVNLPAVSAQILAEEFNSDGSAYMQTMQQDSSFAYLVRKADKEKAEEARKKLREAGCTGIYLLKATKRVYPYGQIAGQVIGMVDTDGNGLTGLELQYNDLLRGIDGSISQDSGRDGTPVAGGNTSIKEPVDGDDLVVSLDVDIQKVAEEQVQGGVSTYKAESGFCMVTDPSTGEILAACSTPLLDASDLTVVEDGATSLKLVSDSYEPGSIFKVLTAAIGLESGSVDTYTTFSVPPTVVVGSDIVQDDDDRSKTMRMDLREILRRSSNTGAATVAQDAIGAQTFAEGVNKFQIGTATGIDYPGESAGLVTQLQDYVGSTLGSMSFGQGLAVPMVQMVKAVGSIADGGTLRTPHFLVSRNGKAVDWPSVGQSVSSQTAEEVTDMLRTVVTDGTAVEAQVTGYDIAGKTGTGEQASEKGGYVKGKYLSSMIGYGPAGDAQVLCYVGLYESSEHAATSAAPVFSAIMSEALADRGVQPES